MQKFLFVAILSLNLFWVSVVAASENTMTNCTFGNVSINEVDYDQPGVDTLEFIELQGTPSVSLSRYQLRLVNSNGTIYYSQSLDGHRITSSGFFVIGNAALFSTPQITIEDNTMSNNTAVVALYDVDDNSYCSTINYEGTVSGFNSWFNIGFDSEAHGEGRSCARASAGWWSCNRPATPGGSNGVVAVQLGTSGTNTPLPIGILLLFTLSGIVTGQFLILCGKKRSA